MRVFSQLPRIYYFVEYCRVMPQVNVFQAWQLWEGGRCLELIESSIAKEIDHSVATKYINIVLMCVQENADDRPTMSDVVTMLSSENVVLPEPKHPAYCNLRVSKIAESESGYQLYSVNSVTITHTQEGR